jgi:hypothetical protein
LTTASVAIDGSKFKAVNNRELARAEWRQSGNESQDSDCADRWQTFSRPARSAAPSSPVHS